MSRLRTHNDLTTDLVREPTVGKGGFRSLRSTRLNGRRGSRNIGLSFRDEVLVSRFVKSEEGSENRFSPLTLVSPSRVPTSLLWVNSLPI